MGRGKTCACRPVHKMTGEHQSADAWQGAQGRRHREVQNPIVPLTGHVYAEIISTKGLTAHQKNNP